MVRICLPAASRTMVEQLNVRLPSTSTMHAPHAPSPQPYFVPVSFRSSRSTSSNERSGSVVTSTVFPFTESFVRIGSAIGHLRARVLLLVEVLVQEHDRSAPRLLRRVGVLAVFAGLLAQEAVAGAFVHVGLVRLVELLQFLLRVVDGAADAPVVAAVAAQDGRVD